MGRAFARPGSPVEIDAEIAPLIELCWYRGLDTFLSCQDHGGDGRVWIEFDGPSASDFLNVVAGSDSELRRECAAVRSGGGGAG